MNEENDTSAVSPRQYQPADAGQTTARRSILRDDEEYYRKLEESLQEVKRLANERLKLPRDNENELDRYNYLFPTNARRKGYVLKEPERLQLFEQEIHNEQYNAKLDEWKAEAESQRKAKAEQEAAKRLAPAALAPTSRIDWTQSLDHDDDDSPGYDTDFDDPDEDEEPEPTWDDFPVLDVFPADENENRKVTISMPDGDTREWHGFYRQGQMAALRRWLAATAAEMGIKVLLDKGIPYIPERILFQARRKARDADAAGSIGHYETNPLSLVELEKQPENVPLIEGVLYRGQLTIMPALEKSFKTWVAILMSLSIAAGRPFLGHFAVSRRLKVLYFGGEGKQDYPRRLRAACDFYDRLAEESDNKTIKPEPIKLAIGDNLKIERSIPDLTTPGGRKVFEDAIDGYDVVVLDPFTLASAGTNTATLASVAEIIAFIIRVCDAADVTPLLVVHTSRAARSKRGEFSPPTFREATGAGLAELCRAWICLGPASPFPADDTPRQVWLNAGGSDGHGGLFRLTIDEGSKDNRRFHVDVTEAEAGGAVVQNAGGSGVKRGRGKGNVVKAVAMAIMKELRGRPAGDTEGQIRESLGDPHYPTFKKAIQQLRKRKKIIDRGIKKGNRTIPGIALAEVEVQKPKK